MRLRLNLMYLAWASFFSLTTSSCKASASSSSLSLSLALWECSDSDGGGGGGGAGVAFFPLDLLAWDCLLLPLPLGDCFLLPLLLGAGGVVGSCNSAVFLRCKHSWTARAVTPWLRSGVVPSTFASPWAALGLTDFGGAALAFTAVAGCFCALRFGSPRSSWLWTSRLNLGSRSPSSMVDLDSLICGLGVFLTSSLLLFTSSSVAGTVEASEPGRKKKISLINITNKNNQPHHRWYVWLVLCSFLWASSLYTCMHACVYVLVCYTTLTSWTLKRTWSQACIARQCLPRTLELPGPQTSLHQVEHALPSLLLGLSSQQKIFGD